MFKRLTRTSIVSGVVGHHFCSYSRLVGVVPEVMDEGRKLAWYMHRANTSVSDYCPIGIAKHLMCLADYYLAMGMDHVRLVVVVDLSTLRLGHLARYPLGTLRNFFLYAWVSGWQIFYVSIFFSFYSL